MSTSSTPAAATQRNTKLRVLLRLGRVSNLPTVWSNVIAGAVLGGSTLVTENVFLLVVSASLFYVGGMFLNDAFDRDIDARERPERPIPSGEISAAQVFGGGFGLLAGGAAVALLAASSLGVETTGVAIAAAALAAAIVLYDLAHKGNPLAPIVMGSCRAIVYVLAALASGGDFDAGLQLPAIAILAYVAGLTYVAAQENLREVKNWWPVVLLAAPALFALRQLPQQPISAAFLMLLIVWTGAALARIAGKGPRDVPGTVTRLIAGISLVDALAIAAVGGTGPAAIAAVGLVATRIFQRSIPGT